MKTVAGKETRVVVGLGKTGYSCVRYLKAQGFPVTVMDSKLQPALANILQSEYPDVPCYFGGYDQAALLSASEIILSPGVPLATPEIAAAVAQGIPVLGDIDLFVRAYSGQIIAITGSNGKSTVTALVGAMAEAAGIPSAVGGNIGVPVLELLDKGYELVVLELSSFQLETCHELQGHVATVLNLSEDHMDRYPDLQGYMMAKHRIFRQAAHVVANREDAMTQPLVSGGAQLWWYALNDSLIKGFSAPVGAQGARVLQLNQQPLITQSDMGLKGTHNVLNALAALSLGAAAGIDTQSMVQALKAFTGLPHRCQKVATLEGVDYINDSKATNVGAALAAIEGLHIQGQKNLILIAGGLGKDADFSPMTAAVTASCKHLMLMGKAAEELATVLGEVPHTLVHSMEQAVSTARRIAQPGDTVLLAPACASFDMFEGFEHRGRMFAAAVEALS